MEVILKTSIKGLGDALDIITVKDGYARNYLFPGQLATMATKSAKQLIKVDLEKAKGIYLRAHKMSEDIVARLQGLEINILSKVSDGDKLYGSVTGKEISAEINKLGFTIDAKQIKLDKPVKNLGMYSVTVNIPPALKTTIKVWVVDETTQS